MQYLGIDWGTRRASWCVIDEDGTSGRARSRWTGMVWQASVDARQWGLRRSLTAQRKPGAINELAEHSVPMVWRQSIVTLLGVIDDLDAQLEALERELRPHAR
jgi:hypothetical protein